MENYIKKLNNRVITRHEEKTQLKIKKTYLISGSITLALGLAGFLASFITFMVLFFDFKTDAAFIAWEVAVPFMVMIIAGSVVVRIGDMLLRDFVAKEYEEDKIRNAKLKEEKENKKLQKKKAKENAVNIEVVENSKDEKIEENKIEENQLPLEDEKTEKSE